MAPTHYVWLCLGVNAETLAHVGLVVTTKLPPSAFADVRGTQPSVNFDSVHLNSVHFDSVNFGR